MKRTILATAAVLALTGCGSSQPVTDELLPVKQETPTPQWDQGVGVGGDLGDVTDDA